MSLRKLASFWRDHRETANESILEAAERGDVAAIERGLSRGANINACDRYGETPLMWAAFNGRTESVSFLLKNNADVGVRAWLDSTAIHLAADNGSVEIVKLLAQYGADIHQKDLQGRTSLHRACIKGHFRVVEALLDLGVQVDVQTNRGNTGIGLAAQYGHYETVALLIKKSADLLKTPDFGGWTPLHRAAASSNAKLVQLLIDAGADVNVQNTVGATPLHVAVTEADETCLEIVELLLYNGASLSRRTIDHKKPIDFTDNPKVKEFLKKPHPYQVPSLKKLATTAIWRYHLHTDIKGLPQELQKYVRNTL